VQEKKRFPPYFLRFPPVPFNLQLAGRFRPRSNTYFAKLDALSLPLLSVP
jgi:hypothetical protein